jgi:hypothetical protein
MASKRIYTVHIKPEMKNPYEDPVFIEEKFNFLAFIFHILWAFYYRLWWVAAGLFALEIMLRAFAYQGSLSHLNATIIGLGVQMLLGFHANDFRRAKLRKQGYITSDIVVSDSLIAAEQRFFERHFPRHHLMQHRVAG